MVEDRLFEGWSPEQICGRLGMQGVTMAGCQWMYTCIRADREAGGRRYLCRCRCGKKPDWKGGRHAGRRQIPGCVNISERPAVVGAKERVGGWKADTIGKGHSGAVVSLVECASKYMLLERVGRKTAASVGTACRACCCHCVAWCTR